jgi:hypothetical protein
MPLAEFKPAIPASEWLQALDRSSINILVQNNGKRMLTMQYVPHENLDKMKDLT